MKAKGFVGSRAHAAKGEQTKSSQLFLSVPPEKEDDAPSLAAHTLTSFLNTSSRLIFHTHQQRQVKYTFGIIQRVEA
jgi:hypothetical protein